MPRKKPEEKDQELDIKKQVKKETFVSTWFNEYAVNDKSSIMRICDVTKQMVWQQFVFDAKNPQVYAVIFYGTFLSILKFIKKNQKVYNDFTIKIANSINIGYVNNTDEDNEKVGNFMPVMEYIGINKRVEVVGKINEDTTPVNLNSWIELNTKKNVDYYNEIQADACKLLADEFRISLRHQECIFPFFCIFLDNIIGILKLKYQEAQGTDVSEVSMNILGLFDVFYSFDEDNNQEIIEFQPNIRMKLELKSDEIAGR